jgi:uncharacterized membrane protein YdjX (TVP38/TMEM64 family)
MLALRPLLHAPLLRHHWRRALGLLLLCALVAALLSVDALFALLERALAAAEPFIAARPLAGPLLFVLLSAASAMLAFFSSAVLVPVAVYNWGRGTTVVLLWLGWLLGGVCTYAVGRYFGGPILRGLVPVRLADFYLRRLPAQVDFTTALLFQVAMPSEVPGYLFGTLRVPFHRYLGVLALVEAPFAVGTVLLGESVIRREGGGLLLLAAVGLTASMVAVHRLQRRLKRSGAAGE